MPKTPSSIRGALRNLKEMFYELIGLSITDNSCQPLTENDKLRLENAVLENLVDQLSGDLAIAEMELVSLRKILCARKTIKKNKDE